MGLKFNVAVLAALLWAPAASATTIQAPQGKFEVLGAMTGSDDVYDEDAAQAGPSGSLEKTIVPFTRDMAPGSILIKTGERRLYYVLPDRQAIQYPVGVGKQGFTWSGKNSIARKAKWPTWRPPQVMIQREAERGRELPTEMKGGPRNPLGARALYIGATEYRIHGTTQPWSIGRAVSSGCIRMLNAHVIDLYDRVAVGATVVVER